MEFAILYVPSNCEARPSSCRVHVNYHGCTVVNLTHRAFWALHIDLNEYGEANDIVIVYPQVSGDDATGALRLESSSPPD